MLDQLTAWARHALIAFFGPALGLIARDIITAHGVSGLVWRDELTNALNIGLVSLAAAMLVLWVTPATRQYGVGTQW